MLTTSGAMEVTITPDTAAYVDGDVVGGLLTFSAIAGSHDGGVLQNVTLVDDDNEGAAVDLFLFDQVPSTIADNAAFAPTLADLKKLCAKVAIAVADHSTENSIKFATKTGLDVPLPSRKVWGYLVLNGAGATYAASKTIFIRLLVTTG